MKPNSYFMVVPEANRYRWLGRRSDDDGLTLARIRHAPVAASWLPIDVEWLPETQGRPLCDFPIFTPIVRCMSLRAATALQPFLSGNVELLPLRGEEGYLGFHCINWLDAADLVGINPDRTSIHSTMFVPKLKAHVISSQHVFSVPQMIAKLFVSSEVERAIRESSLTGLEFYEVELT